VVRYVSASGLKCGRATDYGRLAHSTIVIRHFWYMNHWPRLFWNQVWPNLGGPGWSLPPAGVSWAWSASTPISPSSAVVGCCLVGGANWGLCPRLMLSEQSRIRLSAKPTVPEAGPPCIVSFALCSRAGNVACKCNYHCIRPPSVSPLL